MLRGDWSCRTELPWLAGGLCALFGGTERHMSPAEPVQATGGACAGCEAVSDFWEPETPQAVEFGEGERPGLLGLDLMHSDTS